MKPSSPVVDRDGLRQYLRLFFSLLTVPARVQNTVLVYVYLSLELI